MVDVVSLDDYRPHVSVLDPVSVTAYVLPVMMIEDFVNGALPLEAIQNKEAVMRALLNMLLENLDYD